MELARFCLAVRYFPALIQLTLWLSLSASAGPAFAQEAVAEPSWVASSAVDPVHAHFAIGPVYRQEILPDDGPRYSRPVAGAGGEAFEQSVRAYEQGDAAAAESAFDQFARRFPASELLPAVRAFQAELLLRQSRADRSVQQAIELYRTLLRDTANSPNGARARWRLGDLYAEQGFQVEARSHYERGLADSANPYDANRSLLGLAVLFMQAEKWKEAEQSFELLRQRSEDERLLQHATVGLADAYYEQQKYKESQPLYATALLRWPDVLKMRPRSLLAFADTLMSLRQDSAARKVYTLYYNVYPHEAEAPNVLVRIGDSFREGRQRQLASIFYAKAVTQHPGTDSAVRSRMRLAELGQDILTTGGRHIPEWVDEIAVRNPVGPSTDPTEIQATFETVAAEQRDTSLGSEALFHLGRFHEWRNERAKAVATYENLVARAGVFLFDPWPAKGAQRLSAILKPWILAALDAGDQWTALTLFHRLGAAGPYVYEGTSMLVRVADAHLLLGFPDEAVPLYQAVIRHTKSPRLNEDGLLGLGRAYLDQHDYSAARGVLERYRIQYPLGRRTTDAQLFLARALSKMGEAKRVVRLCKTWLARNPRHPARVDMWLLLARAQADTDQARDAARSYDHVVKAGRLSNPSHMIHFGDVLLEAGRHKDAIQWYRKAIARAARPSEREWARLRLARAFFLRGRYPDAGQVLAEIEQNSTDGVAAPLVAAMRTEIAMAVKQ